MSLIVNLNIGYTANVGFKQTKIRSSFFSMLQIINNDTLVNGKNGFKHKNEFGDWFL